MNALSGRIKEQCKRDDEVINEHLDMLIELLLGYKVTEWILFSYRIHSFLVRIYVNDSKKLYKTNKKPHKKPIINKDVQRMQLPIHQLK
jgi:hypothetical protein